MLTVHPPISGIVLVHMCTCVRAPARIRIYVHVQYVCSIRKKGTLAYIVETVYIYVYILYMYMYLWVCKCIDIFV